LRNWTWYVAINTDNYLSLRRSKRLFRWVQKLSAKGIEWWRGFGCGGLPCLLGIEPLHERNHACTGSWRQWPTQENSHDARLCQRCISGVCSAWSPRFH
jgi:hypothetical protein